MRRKRLRSSSVFTLASAIGVQKLGQPVPDSNLVRESKRSLPQAAHVYVPESVVPEPSRERALGPPLAEDAVLLGCQSGPPLLIALLDPIGRSLHHGANLPPPRSVGSDVNRSGEPPADRCVRRAAREGTLRAGRPTPSA